MNPFFTLLFVVTVGVPPQEVLQQNRDFLLHQLENSSPDLRINALNKLSELRQPQATIKPIAKLLDDPNMEVRFSAMRAITKMPNDEGLAILKEKVGKEGDPYLASELRRSIKSIEETLKASADKQEQKLNPKGKGAAKPPKKGKGSSKKSQ